MKLSFNDIKKNDFLTTMLLRSVVLKEKHHEYDKDGKLDIKLLINGEEYPIVEAFESIRQYQQERVKKAAQELINQKIYNEITDVLMDKIDDIQIELNSKIDNFKITDKDLDEYYEEV